jgi:hypothetical protein
VTDATRLLTLHELPSLTAVPYAVIERCRSAKLPRSSREWAAAAARAPAMTRTLAATAGTRQSTPRCAE